jgi:hypothetical protein
MLADIKDSCEGCSRVFPTLNTGCLDIAYAACYAAESITAHTLVSASRLRVARCELCGADCD